MRGGFLHVKNYSASQGKLHRRGAFVRTMDQRRGVSTQSAGEVELPEVYRELPQVQEQIRQLRQLVEACGFDLCVWAEGG